MRYTESNPTNLSFGNSYFRYEPNEVSTGGTKHNGAYFGIAYKGAGEPPVTPRLLEYKQPIGATLEQVEARYQTYKKTFWWKVTFPEVTYTQSTGANNQNTIKFLIPGDATHADTIHPGTWLMNWKSAELETVII